MGTNEVHSHVLCSTSELLQELLRFVVARQASTVEFLFMFTDQYKYVNICSSYKVIESVQNVWTKLFNSCRLVLQSLHDHFEASNW